MKKEISEFLKDKTEFTPINGFLRQYITAAKKPNSRESVSDIKGELIKLVASGELEIENGAHQNLCVPIPSQINPNGLALPTKYVLLEDVTLRAKLPE